MRNYTWLLFLLFSFGLHAETFYIVHFTDKRDNGFSIREPEKFLSPEAILRRQREGVAIFNDDLPVSASYVQAVLQWPVTFQYALKGENAAVFRGPAGLQQNLRQLGCVKSVKEVEVQRTNRPSKFASEEQQLKSASFKDIPLSYYGNAANQLQMLGLEQLHRRGYQGQGVRISMMDNGFFGAPNNHAFDSVFQTGRLLRTYNFVRNNSDVFSAGGHGLSTWSCIAANLPEKMVGTAPSAEFMLFVTEDDQSETILEEYNWARAAEVADSMGAEVLSTSLGYTTFDASDSANSHKYSDLNGNSTPITRAANRAASKGMLVINSAGNEGNSPWYFISAPADGDSVIAVGAVDKDGHYAVFSSHGPNAAGKMKPDLCAQGAGTTVVNTAGIVTYSNGTSFSCPVLAGAFACLRQAFPEKTNRELQLAVQESANYAHQPNYQYGYGIPNFESAYFRLKHPEWFIPTANQEAVRIWPNPIDNYLEVAIGEKVSTGWHRLHICNSNGTEVLAKTVFRETAGFQVVTMQEVADLPAGNYFIFWDNQKAKQFLKR
ncbi:MAG: S8 family serine peptidase [Chitinophagales bacterium]